jgi:hypothetical protein
MQALDLRHLQEKTSGRGEKRKTKKNKNKKTKNKKKKEKIKKSPCRIHPQLRHQGLLERQPYL